MRIDEGAHISNYQNILLLENESRRVELGACPTKGGRLN
jgi:hypothetical protein